MYCESCGSFIPDGQSFCANCGSPVKDQAPAQETSPAPAPAPAPESAPAPAVSAFAAAPAPAQPVQPFQPQYQQPAYGQVQPVYTQPVYAQPVAVRPVAQTPAKSSNGAAIAGMVFGILAFILFWIPFFNIITTALFGLLGLIFSIIGIAKKNAGGKAMAIVGLVLTIFATILTILYYVFIYKIIITDPELSQEFEEIFDTVDTYSPATPHSNSDEFFIDGDFVTTDNGYVSGVLHIDGYIVEF